MTHHNLQNKQFTWKWNLQVKDYMPGSLFLCEQECDLFIEEKYNRCIWQLLIASSVKVFTLNLPSFLQPKQKKSMYGTVFVTVSTVTKQQMFKWIVLFLCPVKYFCSIQDERELCEQQLKPLQKKYKKVLLRERKRYTDHSISSTPSAVLSRGGGDS